MKQFSTSLFLVVFLSIIFIQCKNKPENTQDLKAIFQNVLEGNNLQKTTELSITQSFDKKGITPTKGKSVSGYDYTIFSKQKGNLPKQGDWISYHVNQYNRDKLMFSSYNMPNPFQTECKPDPVQKNPVSEALYLMRSGDSMSMNVKVDKLPRIPQGYKKGEVVRFELRSVGLTLQSDFEDKKAAAKAKGEQIVPHLNSNILPLSDKNLQTTNSGLKYLVLKEGKGKQIQNGNDVAVYYIGMFEDGTIFNNNYQSGHPFRFEKGKDQVIKGWEEGIALMNHGGTAIFHIPYELAYGKAGDEKAKIPEEANLIFYVEIL